MSNSDNPLVSVIVPSYNVEPYIDKCIRSLTAQTYGNIEIIAVNDGSIDKSGAIIEDIAKTDERIRFINQPNQGVCIARNNGIAAATGDYLLFVDGDDYVDPDYIENMVTTAQKNDSDLVISGYTEEGSDKTQEVIPDSYVKDADEMWAYRIMAAWGRLYRKDFWIDNNLSFTLEPKARGEDLPVALLSNYLGKNISICKTSGYHYVQREGSAMTEFAGFRKYTFPKEAFKDVEEAFGTDLAHNSEKFYKYGILKTFAQFSFQLAKGADRNVKKDLDRYFARFVRANIPDHIKVCLSVKKGSLPFYIRVAVILFSIKCLLTR